MAFILISVPQLHSNVSSSPGPKLRWKVSSSLGPPLPGKVFPPRGTRVPCTVLSRTWNSMSSIGSHTNSGETSVYQHTYLHKPLKKLSLQWSWTLQSGNGGSSNNTVMLLE